MIPLQKPSSLPELPENVRTNPLEVEKLSDNNSSEEQQVEQIKEAVEQVIDEVDKEDNNIERTNIDEVLFNHEQRLQAIESILLRIRGAI